MLIITWKGQPILAGICLPDCHSGTLKVVLYTATEQQDDMRTLIPCVSVLMICSVPDGLISHNNMGGICAGSLILWTLMWRGLEQLTL